MSAQSGIVIACDIGGVIKNQINDEPIESAVECLIKLSQSPSNAIIFISKCKDSYKQKSNMWLEQYNLSHIRAYYCLEYDEKIKIANDNNVNVMIDDKMQVLRSFPMSITKIWFCSDPKKIEGAQKFQPDFLNSVRIARSWEEIMEIIEQIKS